MAECSSFLTSELNIIWKSRSELASTPMRGSRFAGGWSRAIVTRPTSCDRAVHPWIVNAISSKHTNRIEIDGNCFSPVYTGQLYSHATRFKFCHRLAKLFDLACNTSLPIDAV